MTRAYPHPTPATETEAPLHLIRAALVEAIDAAALKAQRECREYASMPKALLSASLYLASQGYPALPTAGERYFAWGMRRCRKYLRGLPAGAYAEEVEAGRRACEGLATRFTRLVPHDGLGFLVADAA